MCSHYPLQKKTNLQCKAVEENNHNNKFFNVKIEPVHHKSNAIILDLQNNRQRTLSTFAEEGFLTTNTFRKRTQSMAKLRIYQKKQADRNSNIKYKNSNRNMSNKNLKSFSNLLKDIKINSKQNKESVTPILHQQNSLYKRYQRLYQKQNQRKIEIEYDQNESNQNEKYINNKSNLKYKNKLRTSTKNVDGEKDKSGEANDDDESYQILVQADD